MEKILTPGEPKLAPEIIVEGSVHAWLDVSLGDLRAWTEGHHAPVQACGLIRRYGDALVQFGRAGSVLPRSSAPGQV